MSRFFIGHQAAFIKLELFNLYGLYDESLELVSDWKFFFEVILFHKCSAKYLDIDVVVYDLNGISSKNKEQLLEERHKVLHEFLPDFVVDDYMNEIHMNEIFNHRIGRKAISFIYHLKKVKKMKD